MQLHSYVLTTAKVSGYSTDNKIESIKRFLSVMYQIPYTEITTNSNEFWQGEYLSTFYVDKYPVYFYHKKAEVNNA